MRVRFEGCDVQAIPATAGLARPGCLGIPEFRSGPEQFPGSRVTYFGGGNFMKVQSWAVFISASPLPA